jgi:CDP-glucose 4,6-dehydratase
LGIRVRTVADLAVSALSREFWRGRKVFLTGHTGFKGSWLTIWLNSLGASVFGLALEPPTKPNLFDVAKVSGLLDASTIVDVRDPAAVNSAMHAADPDIVIHMAAQPLVRAGYHDPVQTFAVNIMGTAHVLEAARGCPRLRAIVVVSSDKCYETTARGGAYVETDAMGGADPYSASKGCVELVTASYARSFFARPNDGGLQDVVVASVRAGNVIGGGDWSVNRIVPDFFRAVSAGQPLLVRNPNAVRPWQHVLEPLGGYLLLLERSVVHGRDIGGAWNFGPDRASCWPVSALVERLVAAWGNGACWQHDSAAHPPEAGHLRLDSGKAQKKLGWRPRWALDQALERTVAWTRSYEASADMRKVCRAEIDEYMASAVAN